jgi:hypothetical protein
MIIAASFTFTLAFALSFTLSLQRQGDRFAKVLEKAKLDGRNLLVVKHSPCPVVWAT